MTDSPSGRDSEVEIERLEEAVAALPDNLPIRLQLAEAYLAAADYDGARAQYQEALSRGAGAGAKLGLATVLFEQGLYGGAAGALEPARSSRRSSSWRA
jgi:tetratricopeptide (TPR) repeat protein